MCRRRGTGRSPTFGCPRRRWRCRASRRQLACPAGFAEHPASIAQAPVPAASGAENSRQGQGLPRISGRTEFRLHLVEVAFAHSRAPSRRKAVGLPGPSGSRLPSATPGFRVLVELVNAVEGLDDAARGTARRRGYGCAWLVNHRLRASW